MSEVGHVATVEDFWRMYNHIPRPSQIFSDGESVRKVGDSGKIIGEYSFFKKGIEPEWGDSKNCIGGEWFCRQSFDADQLDLYWENLLMGCIGETIEDGSFKGKRELDIVNGARVVDKSRNFPLFRLELWVSTRDEDLKAKLLKQLEQIVTDGQQSHMKTTPKFDWKDHSA